MEEIVRASIFLPINKDKAKSIEEGKPFFIMVKGDSSFGNKQIGIIKRNTTKFEEMLEKLVQLYEESKLGYFKLHEEKFTEDDSEKDIMILDDLSDSMDYFDSAEEAENIDQEEKKEQEISPAVSKESELEKAPSESDTAVKNENSLEDNQEVSVEHEQEKSIAAKVEKRNEFDISSLGEIKISDVKELDARELYSLSEISESEQAYSRKDFNMPSIDELLKGSAKEVSSVVKKAI